ncbi:MAG: DNA polymerase III subunit gamma/tau [Saprospiraceae bacterium]
MNGFLVSARKYRPLRWTDVIGQDHITQTLKNSLARNQVAHAFLFCGPRGVGKTTCARIMARVLNCENPTPDWEPCNQCKTCQAFQENNSFNIFEIDAASNNSVEDFRNLAEQVRYQPQYGRYKIYIIDEVHMLSQAAFNAFLKTLEEPPPFAKFILATTERHKIIPTILSRCQVYDFRRIAIKDIVYQLEIICKEESLQAETEALYLIAQKADGAMRDALSIFDRIRSYSEHQITYQAVLENLNILDYDYYFRFFNAFLSEDTNQALIICDQVIRLGFDPEIILEGLAEHSRNLLVSKIGESVKLFEGSEQLRDRYLQQAQASTQSFLLSALDMLGEAEVNISKTRNKRLQLEILLAKLSKFQRRIAQGSEDIMSVVIKSTKPAETKNFQITIPSAKKKNEEEQIISEETPRVIVRPPSKDIVSSSASAIPKLASLDTIRKKISEDEKEKAASRISLNQENFSSFWQEILIRQKSKTLQEYMKNVEWKIGVDEILIMTSGVLANESIRNELRLEEEINNRFAGERITLRVEINPELAQREEQNKPKKLLSAKEKWDHLIAINPALEELKKKLDLKVDED